MNWENLKENRCPKCVDYLKEEEKGYRCTNRKCTFFIGKDKFNQHKNERNTNE